MLCIMAGMDPKDCIALFGISTWVYSDRAVDSRPALVFSSLVRRPFPGPHGPDSAESCGVHTGAVLGQSYVVFYACPVETTSRSKMNVLVAGFTGDDTSRAVFLGCLLGWCWCSLPSSVTATWARIALSLSLVWCLCSFLSWRRDSSLGLPIQLTIEIVQLQPIDKVFDVSVVQDQQVLRVLTWRRWSSLHSCSSLKLPG